MCHVINLNIYLKLKHLLHNILEIIQRYENTIQKVT